MKRRKVIAFFCVLLVFALALVIMQVTRFGSMLGFVSVNVSNASELTSENSNQNLIGIFLLVFMFILFAGLIVRVMKVRRERNSTSRHEGGHHRALISMDLNGEYDPKGNF